MNISKDEALKIISSLEKADSDLDQFGCDPKYITRKALKQAKELLLTKLKEETHD